MESFQAIELEIPLFQMVLYVLVITFCLLFRRIRLGLATSYVFVFYWGYIYNREKFFSPSEGVTTFALLYFFFGIMILLLGLFSFFVHEKD